MTRRRTRGSRLAVWGPVGALAAAAALGCVMIGVSLAAPAPAANVRPTARVANCTEGECHAKQRQYKFLHGPAAVGACDACHAYVDEQKHTFQMKRAEKDLCGFCHVGMLAGQVVHKPIKEGQCLGCHDPHGSANREMLRSENMGQLCKNCHGDVTKGRKNVHGPAVSGNCAACHNAHTSDHPHLLVAEGRALCLGCHKEMAQQMKTVKFTHKPAEGDCLQCHEAHASNHVMQLREEPVDLCLSCHAQVKKAAQEMAHKHSAVITGQACLNCHTSHGSDLAKLMKGGLIQACLACHDKPIATADGRTVAAVSELGQTNLVKHGPIRDGNCSGCHTLHGGPVSRLLSQPYPETFYQAFSLDAYALCFTCHDKQLVLAPTTEGLTRFRDGETNLHYLHVNKPTRGRSCFACHMTHASSHPAHVRDSVPFGNWQIPINFTPTASGGSCAPGCHRAASYDRQHPVNPSPVGPASAVTASVADKKEDAK